MANKHLVFTRVNRCHKCCAYYLATRKKSTFENDVNTNWQQLVTEYNIATHRSVMYWSLWWSSEYLYCSCSCFLPTC